MSTIVFVCGDRPQISLGSRDVVAIDGLCRDPDQLRDLDVQPSRVVVALHRDRFSLPDVQRALRAIDVDPLGAQILEVGGISDSEALEVSAEGLFAKASVYTGSAPEHAKPVFPRAVTRRGFLRPPMPAYVAAPRVDHGRCTADTGCRACIEVCPQDAYSWQGDRMAFDKDACIPCGRCVTTCPTAAIGNPAITAVMVEAQARAIVSASHSAVGIRFVCSRGRIAPRHGWADVMVPCSSMVPGSWLLACLVVGAGAAHCVPCSASGCSLGLDASAIQANDFAHAVLAESGFDPSMVDGATVNEPLTVDDVDNPFGRHSAVDVMLALSAATGAIDVRHPAADIGVVEIDSSACTLCGQCAKTCPTKALIEVYEGDTVSISFDARACVNCTQCVSACPEVGRGAISVTGRVATALMSAGRMDLNEGTVSLCELCGNVIAPSMMMNRIGDLLGAEFESTTEMLGKRCLDCRGRR